MTQTAINYGDALYELACEDRLSGEILQELEAVSDLLSQNPDYVRLLSAPNIPKAERCRILDEAFRGKVQLYLLNFLKLLCECGYIRQVKACCKQYRLRYNEDNGIMEAVAVTAVPLSGALKNKLMQKLEAITGKQIDLRLCVDPAVIGGIRLEMDGQQMDGTVRHRLDELRRILSDTVL